MTRTGAAVLMVTLSVGAAGCASSHRAISSVRTTDGTAPATSPAPMHQAAPCVGSCLWARQGRLDSLAGYATRVAGAVHVFAGVRIDNPSNKVILYLVHAPQSVIARIVKGHPDTYVIHNNVPRTWHDVRVLQDSLDWQAWAAKGVHIVSTGPTQNGYLEVGVMSSIKKAQALFDAAYPSGVIRVIRGERVMLTSLTGPTGPTRKP